MDIREHDPKVWEEKLVGKKIGDSHDQSVSVGPLQNTTILLMRI